jgi:hypothetical protein
MHNPCVKVYVRFLPDDAINFDGSIMTDEVSVTGVFWEHSTDVTVWPSATVIKMVPVHLKKKRKKKKSKFLLTSALLTANPK